MTFEQQRKDLLFKISKVDAVDFDQLALQVFRFQGTYNPLYAKFLALLAIKVDKIQSIDEIPFLPIEFFKNYDLQTGDWNAEIQFESSGTTGAKTSRHFVRDLNWYRHNARKAFSKLYKPPASYCFLALLPGYLERQNSSLVFMVDDFVRQSNFKESGFYLNDMEALHQQILACQTKNIPIVLFGVSFALLDFAAQFPIDYSNLIIMETGGMKGRRKEMTRIELHDILQKAFKAAQINSEYGMTELLSQAYSKTGGKFDAAPTMKVCCRDISDPFHILPAHRTGAVNIIDLANLDSCSFIATDDLGRMDKEGRFEILGRLDQSDIRGCNLLVL